jgi:cell division protein FtsL
MSEMEINQYIERILSYKTYSDKRKIDSLLHQLAILWQNTGTDSTKTEINEVKRKSRIIYRAIKHIDPALGSRFLNTADA